MKRSEKGSRGEASVLDSLGAVVLEGWLYRRSTAVDGVINRRYGVLYSQHIATFKHDKDREKKPPSKIWPLCGRCKSTELGKKEFLIRGKHSSTLWALATGHYEKKDLDFFTVSWPAGHYFSKNSLQLCFENVELAAQWHKKINGAIGGLSVEVPAYYPALRETTDGASPTSQASDYIPSPLSPMRSNMSGDLRKDSIPQPPISIAAEAVNREIERGVSFSVPSTGNLESTGPDRRWASCKHVNGVAVYQEVEGENGERGAFMVSAIIRSSPESCFTALWQISAKQDLPFMNGTAVLEDGKRSRTIKTVVKPTGLLGSWVLAPREVVMQQTWRQDEDGTFILLMQSSPVADAAPASWNPRAPVRCEMVAAGVTLAPLRPKFVHDKQSQECLVTMVLKMDLGGYLSDHSSLGRLLSPLTHSAIEAFIEPMLMSIISLRDQVEQDRFVVKPFSMGQQAHGQGSDLAVPREPSRRTSLVANMSILQSKSTLPLGPLLRSVTEGPSDSPIEEGSLAAEQEDCSTLDSKYWSCPGTAGYLVRGPNYLKDKKKMQAEDPVFGLGAVDLLEVPEPTFHIARFLPSLKKSAAPFTFIVQLMVPGPPYLSLSMSWTADYDPSATASPDSDSDADSSQSPFDLCLARFLAGDDEDARQRRHSSFKLIPSVVEGSWVIKQSVGNTPVLLGRKLTTSYFRGPNYFEVDVDVGSSIAAAAVVKLVSGATRGLVIDMGVLLEGHTKDELPERLLGTVRFSHLDLREALIMDTTTGIARPRPDKQKLKISSSSKKKR